MKQSKLEADLLLPSAFLVLVFQAQEQFIFSFRCFIFKRNKLSLSAYTDA
jgi:hypothetical protein